MSKCIDSIIRENLNSLGYSRIPNVWDRNIDFKEFQPIVDRIRSLISNSSNDKLMDSCKSPISRNSLEPGFYIVRDDDSIYILIGPGNNWFKLNI